MHARVRARAEHEHGRGSAPRGVYRHSKRGIAGAYAHATTASARAHVRLQSAVGPSVRGAVGRDVAAALRAPQVAAACLVVRPHSPRSSVRSRGSRSPRPAGAITARRLAARAQRRGGERAARALCGAGAAGSIRTHLIFVGAAHSNSCTAKTEMHPAGQRASGAQPLLGTATQSHGLTARPGAHLRPPADTHATPSSLYSAAGRPRHSMYASSASPVPSRLHTAAKS